MSITREEVMEIFFPERKKQPKPKGAGEVAQERWSKPRPVEALVREEAATNQALVERLREERERAEAEQRRARYQHMIDVAWANQRVMQESLRQLRYDPMGLYGPPTLASDLD